MATKAGKGAAVYVSSFPSVSATNEATSTSDRITYQVTNTARRYLDRAAVTTVQTSPDGSVWTTVTTGFSIQYVGGKVIFTSTQPVGTQVRFSAMSYFAMSLLGDAMEWSLTVDATLTEVTTFGAVAKAFAPTVHGASGSFKRWWVDQSFFTNFQTLYVIQLYVDSAGGTRYEAFAWIKSEAIRTPEGGIIDENVPFTVEGELYQV